MSKNVDSFLPRDQDNAPIPVLAPDTIVNVATGAASTATALPSGAQIVEIITTQNTWFEFGTDATSATSATSQYMPAGVAAVYKVPVGATHLAHIQDTAGGRIVITKLV